MGYLFILFMVSFAIQNFLSLIRSHLFIFIFIALGDGSKKILLQFMSRSILLMFSHKNFIVFSLTFRSLIHFEFIFVYGVREYSNFIAVQFSQHHLLKVLSFLPGVMYSCLLYHRLIGHRRRGSVSGLCPAPLGCIYDLEPTPYCFHGCVVV